MCRQIVQHFGGEREACGVTAQHRLVQQVLGDHGLAQPIGTDDDDVGRLFEEGEGEQLLQQRTIDLLGPGVIEVGQWLESTQAGVVRASLETAPLTLAILDLQHARKPRLGDDLLGVRCEPIEVSRRRRARSDSTLGLVAAVMTNGLDGVLICVFMGVLSQELFVVR